MYEQVRGDEAHGRRETESSPGGAVRRGPKRAFVGGEPVQSYPIARDLHVGRMKS